MLTTRLELTSTKSYRSRKYTWHSQLNPKKLKVSKVSDDVNTFYQDLSYHGNITMSYSILHATEYEKLWERFEKIAEEVSSVQIYQNVTENVAHDTWLNVTLVFNESQNLELPWMKISHRNKRRLIFWNIVLNINWFGVFPCNYTPTEINETRVTDNFWRDQSNFNAILQNPGYVRAKFQIYWKY